MIQSPCRHCPNRHQDKNRCLEACDLINRLQTLDTHRRDDTPVCAVDASDEGRYHILSAFDFTPSSLSSPLF